ncbi:MAG: PulJ/GspJ family protein [Candidatus Dormibacteria bacterium]
MGRSRRHRQAGFTLVELMISAALASFILAATVSVIWVAVGANNTWNPRLQANAQVRDLQLAVQYDLEHDSIVLAPQSGSGCTPTTLGTSLTLTGVQMSNVATPAPSVTSVTYGYDSSGKRVSRSTGTAVASDPVYVARNVTAFTWSIDAGCVLVVNMTATDPAASFTDAETLRFRSPVYRPAPSPAP